MHIYFHSLISAFIIFPLLVLIVTIPYMIYEYHKYGAITKKRVLIIFSFIFYLLCIYFLVILPLPKIKDVAAYHGRWYNLKLFEFISDLRNAKQFILTDPSTYISLFTSHRIFEPLFNVLLTIPFGIYLRYYFNKGWFTTIFYTFLLSLFLEITQLTGLYYLYPRPYRMFDVNDLIANTLGGFFGFGITPIFAHFLPSTLELEEEVLRQSKDVTFSRRFIGYLLDLIIIALPVLLFRKYLNYLIIFIIIICYFALSLILFKGQTIGKKIVHIRLENTSILKNIARSFFLDGILLHIYLPLIYFGLNPLYAILIEICCYFFILFNIIGEKWTNQNTLLIDKILKIKVCDTIKHEETYIIKL